VTDTEPLLLLTRDGAVATLTINRQDRLNTLTYAMFARLPRCSPALPPCPGCAPWCCAARAPGRSPRRPGHRL
jgi:hypothetical protein